MENGGGGGAQARTDPHSRIRIRAPDSLTGAGGVMAGSCGPGLAAEGGSAAGAGAGAATEGGGVGGIGSRQTKARKNFVAKHLAHTHTHTTHTRPRECASGDQGFKIILPLEQATDKSLFVFYNLI